MESGRHSHTIEQPYSHAASQEGLVISLLLYALAQISDHQKVRVWAACVELRRPLDLRGLRFRYVGVEQPLSSRPFATELRNSAAKPVFEIACVYPSHPCLLTLLPCPEVVACNLLPSFRGMRTDGWSSDSERCGGRSSNASNSLGVVLRRQSGLVLVATSFWAYLC